MLKLVFAAWIIISCIVIGCASGPVTTQIDKNKNPVVAPPTEFQSPNTAINNFFDSKVSKNKQVQKIKNRSLKILLNQQIAIARELRESGKLLLKPGLSYEFELETFCVNVGLERPVNGDGLFLSDIKGAAKSWLPIILRDYKSKSIAQTDVQVLIWSLLSGARFDQLSQKNQSLILKFFPDAKIKFGSSVIEDKAKDILSSHISEQIMSAKKQLEQYQEVLQDTKLKFTEIENALAPISSRTNTLDVGWLKHEDGYYIHLLANGYQQVRVKIYAPEGIKANTYFNPTQHIALPGQGQRLALSTNMIDRYGDKGNQFIKNLTGASAKEILFTLKYPLDAFKIYGAAQTAIQKTWDNFESSNDFEGDKADAFRHFVWSSLVTQEVGFEKGKEYLEAHEDYPENNPADKSMDIFNNEKGMEYTRQYKGNNFEDDLIQAGLSKIHDGELRWVK